MDIVYIIGMLLAFCLGAYIRKPFHVVRTNTHYESKEKEVCDVSYQRSLANLLAYDGTKQEEYDED